MHSREAEDTHTQIDTMTNQGTFKIMACGPCASAKRRCSKDMPVCARCAKNGAVCSYPVRRLEHACHVYSPEAGAYGSTPTWGGWQPAAATTAVTTSSSNGISTPVPSWTMSDDMQQNPWVYDPWNSHYNPWDYHAPSPAPASPPGESIPGTAPSWFLRPESWSTLAVDQCMAATQVLQLRGVSTPWYAQQMRAWLAQWVAEGHCPLVHGHLHVVGLPARLRDAYLALSAYQARTTATGRTVLCMVADKARELVREETDEQGGRTSRGADGTISALCHYSRTLALCVYLTICLYDGDVQARAQAEEYLDQAKAWACEMQQTAAAAAGTGTLWARLMDQAAVVEGGAGRQALRWQAWVLSESIRRAYMAALLLVQTYRHSTEDGGSSGGSVSGESASSGYAAMAAAASSPSRLTCEGTLVFTGGEGLWNSLSSGLWLSRITDKGGDMRPVQVAGMARLLTALEPTDVDAFTHTVLEALLGARAVDEWRMGGVRVGSFRSRP